MTSDVKNKGTHRITVDGGAISTSVGYNMNTGHAGVYIVRTAYDKDYRSQYAITNQKKISGTKKIYREENGDMINARERRRYHENIGEERARSKRYYNDNRDKIAEQNALYYTNNKDVINARNSRYHYENREKEAGRKKLYRSENMEACKAREHRYQRTHPKERRTYVTAAGSCNLLNTWFVGCRRHHVDSSTIIHVPTEMHITHKHDIRTGMGMDVINALAFGFLFHGEL